MTQQKVLETQMDSLVPCLSKWVREGVVHAKQISGVEHFLNGNPTIERFNSLVPSINKKDIFENTEYLVSILKKLNYGRAITSAGTGSGGIGFRIDRDGLQSSSLAKSYSQLARHWNIDLSDSVWLNAYPFGVTLSNDLFSFDVGARLSVAKKVFPIITSLKKDIVICAQPHWIWMLLHQSWFKKYTELSKQRYFFILGGEWTPSNFHNLFRYRLNISDREANRRYVSTYGIAEVGIGLGIETDIERSDRSKYERFPMIFRKLNNPLLIQEEENELCISSLNSSLTIPIVRYKTGDEAKTEITNDNFLVYGRFKETSTTSRNIYYAICETLKYTENLTGWFKIENETKLSVGVSNDSNLNNIKSTISNYLEKQISIEFVKKTPDEFNKMDGA